MYVIAESPEAYGRKVVCARSTEHGESATAHAAARIWANIASKLPRRASFGSRSRGVFTYFLRRICSAAVELPHSNAESATGGSQVVRTGVEVPIGLLGVPDRSLDVPTVVRD